MNTVKINAFHALQIGSYTHVGRVRSQNQDSSGCFPDAQLAQDVAEKLFIVADGMGGHADGRVASDTAVKTIGEHFYTQRTGAIPARLDAAFHQANKKIFALVKDLPAGQIMGTTCTVLVVSGDHAYVGHVGDSRMYRFHKGTSKQVTNDHSIVAEMVRKGILTSEEAAHHPQRSMLERALGPEAGIQVDAYEIDRLRLHDIFVLCSDGLGEVKMEEVGEIVADQEPQAAAEYLVNLANQRGGMDNCTVQVIRVVAIDENEAVSTIERKAMPDLPKYEPAAFVSATPALQTGVYSSYPAHSVPPSIETVAPPSRKWLIPVGIIMVVGIVVAAIWYNMSLLQAPQTAKSDAVFDEKAYQNNQTNNAARVLGNAPTAADTSGLQRNTVKNDASLAVTTPPLVSGTDITTDPEKPKPQATSNNAGGANTNGANVTGANTTNTSASPTAAIATPKPPDEVPKKSPLEIKLAEAKEKLQAGEYDEAISQYLVLKAQNGGDDGVAAAIERAANTLMSRGDAARNLPEKALTLYQKSQQLVDNATIQKRIEDIKKLTDNNEK